MGQSTGYQQMSSGDLMPPSTGRVHLVSMGNLADPEEHFLRQMTEDANMGAKHRKKGPFKNLRGASHVLNRSRFTSIRKRHGSLEITMNRGMSTREIDGVIARLTSHRFSVHSTWVYLIEGGKRKKLGKLAELDLQRLRLKLFQLLSKKPHIGLLLVDTVEGDMHTHQAHKYKSMKIAGRL